ncbi:Aste57867_13752 [Aphanomyces stellatus]|uniref:Aste57867_13752 protein n=1 Tax=Aphanomyces stellatus TaxID=120398 RepID=A0A485KYY2_9STRA|nr:hypothetical protein As57867_013702 [Aphanomyces stellatus]VFT90585.1 Aste57867_13752 [Aphanomyces stellatus]
MAIVSTWVAARHLLHMAGMLSLNLLVNQVMMNTDTAFVGHLGTKELAGVGLANLWMMVPLLFVQSGLEALNTLSSEAHGAGDHALVGVWLQTALVYVGVCAVPLTLWYCVAVGHLIGLSMADPDIVAYGRDFARVMSFGLVPQLIYTSLTWSFASQDVVDEATVCACIAMVLNICLNQLFIHTFDFGFVGSPLATVVTQVLQLALFVGYTVWWKGYHRTFWHGWSPECIRYARVKEFVALAAPMGFSVSVDWATTATIGIFVAQLGAKVAAAYALLFGLSEVLYSAVGGFASANQILVAQALGEGDVDGAHRTLRLAGSIMFAMIVVSLVATMVLGRQMVSIWTDNVELIDFCMGALPSFAAFVFVYQVRYFLNSCLYAFSMPKVSSISNIVFSWTVAIPMSYVLPIAMGWGLSGLWWAEVLSGMCQVCTVAYFAFKCVVDHINPAESAAEKQHLLSA